MVRRFFRDSAIYVIPAALSSGMSLFTFPLYAHHFTPREYGLLDLLTLAAMLIGWTVALEIYQAVGRFVSGEKDIVRAQSYASTALWFSAGAYILFAVVVELFAAPITHVALGAGVHVSLLRVGVLYMCLGGFLAIPQAQLRWQLRPTAFAIASVINAVVTVGASALLVFAVHLEVEGAILGSLIGSFISLIYVLIVTRGTFHLHFDVAKCKEMLAFSAPLVPSSAGVFLNLYADRLVIQHLRSLSDVGLYGVGYRVAMIVSLLLTGVQGAALPLILARKDEPSAPADLARIFRLFTVLALSAFVVLTILATPAIRILAAPEYQSASSVVPYLVIAVLFAGMYMFAAGVSIGKKTRVMAALTVLAGLGNLTVALILVPMIGIVGAAIATASTSVAWFVALMVVSQRYYRVPHNWPQLISASAVVIGLVGVSMAMLPQGRSQALSPTTLGIRATLVIAGIALSVRLVLGRGSLGVVLRRVTGATARTRVPARQEIGATD